MTTATYTLDELPGRVGQVLGHSDWLLIDQARIDAFAHATGDLQWIHIDPERAAAGPFGATVAHGFLTLSLLPMLSAQAFAVEGGRMSVNYGLDKVRFPAPVPVGSRLRALCKLTSCEPVGGDTSVWQVSMEVTIEREGSDKPVCVAQSLSRRYL
jgi:acyl dehydratase